MHVGIPADGSCCQPPTSPAQCVHLICCCCWSWLAGICIGPQLPTETPIAPVQPANCSDLMSEGQKRVLSVLGVGAESAHLHCIDHLWL